MRIGEFHAGLSGGNYAGTIFDRLRQLDTAEDLKHRIGELEEDGSAMFCDWGIWTDNGDPMAPPPPSDPLSGPGTGFGEMIQ
jgi:hypothetical protein